MVAKRPQNTRQLRKGKGDRVIVARREEAVEDRKAVGEKMVKGSLGFRR